MNSNMNMTQSVHSYIHMHAYTCKHHHLYKFYMIWCALCLSLRYILIGGH